MDDDSNTGIFVPPELCACIIESGALTQGDLYTLVSVSRSFWKECERKLYINPSLMNKDKINRFCTTVQRRPYLAERIYELSLYMPPQTDFQVADLSGLTRTLHLAVNLKSLNTFRESNRINPIVSPEKGEALQTWILQGHAFKLRGFTNTYFELTALQPFIHSQPSLEKLNLLCDGKIDLHHVPFPRLKALACPTSVFQEMCYGRSKYWPNIEVLVLMSISSSREADIMMVQNLFYLRATLRVLCMTRFTCTAGLDIEDIVGGVSQLPLSALTAIEIMDFGWINGSSNDPFGDFFLPAGPFPQLKALRLCIPYKRPEDGVSATDSYYAELNTVAGRLAAATRIMEGTPTLRWLGLLTPNYEHVYARNTGNGPLAKLVLTKPGVPQYTC